MAGSSFAALTVTIDDIRQWMADRARLDAEIAERQAARDKITVRLDAVASLVDKETRDAIFDVATGGSAPTEEVSFSAAIKRAVDAAHEGITFKGLRDGVTVPDFVARMNRSPNILYNAVARLERREEIVRRGKLLISPANLRLIIARHGEDWEGFAANEDADPNDIVLKFAEKCGGSALPQHFITELKSHPSIVEKINRNPQYGYNILSRLVRQEKLVRDGKRYALPRKENEPPSGSPQGGSEEGSQGGHNPPRELFPKPRAVGA